MSTDVSSALQVPRSTRMGDEVIRTTCTPLAEKPDPVKRGTVPGFTTTRGPSVSTSRIPEYSHETCSTIVAPG
ncbi:hypothetical protein [Rathayibacter sp. VKM Ac-2630]|uniref:hypothetical protein n=1 Tax=Rathayibacter sp. VKM Ac-2630 TaxID=1938617 RepID=UPI001300CC60|nr:hypothetical protein [Rathayibacter sp. VKM Ac-2630]